MKSAKFVVGNWKMQGSLELAAQFHRWSQTRRQELPAELQVGLCVPFTLLPAAREMTGVALGAQNLSEYPGGAYTGEISADLLIEQGCRLAIVGHSERRQIFGETSEQVAAKAKRAVESGITPIVCVGETEDEREQGSTFERIDAQLAAVLDALDPAQRRALWIAYEPVWAIGTGRTAMPGQAQEVHAFLRSRLPGDCVDTPLLYGGSVKPDNAGELFAQADIDGGLIGGASLDIEAFDGICRAAAAHIN